MWHNIKTLAKTHRFDEALFLEFASANIDKFSLVRVGELLQVNTWNADSLIDEFRSCQNKPNNKPLK